MQKILRIAVFPPTPEESTLIAEAFPRNLYSIRKVTTVANIIELSIDEDALFDAVVIPYNLDSNLNALQLCTEIKNNRQTATIPVIGICAQDNPSIVISFYNSGAENVLVAPINAELAYYTVLALSTQRARTLEVFQLENEHKLLSQATIEALDAAREAILIFSTDLEIIFVNRACELLLNINPGKTQPRYNEFKRFFQILIKAHRVEQEHANVTKAELPAVSLARTDVPRIDNPPFAANLRIKTLHTQDRQEAGYAIIIEDLAELELLKLMLSQAETTRSLFLITAGLCKSYLLNKHGTILLQPVERLKELISEETKRSSLNETLTVLLEFFDLIVDPETKINVHLEELPSLAVRPTDLFQMLGHVILYAVNFAGKNGEVEIIAAPATGISGIPVTIKATSKLLNVRIAGDPLSELITSKLGHSITDGTNPIDLIYSLKEAQKIAELYRTTFEYQTVSNSEVKFRISLPVSGN